MVLYLSVEQHLLTRYIFMKGLNFSSHLLVYSNILI